MITDFMTVEFAVRLTVAGHTISVLALLGRITVLHT